MLENITLFLVNAILTVMLTVLIVSAIIPETVGYWKARSDAAYDSIMAEYAADCDCTQPLE